MKYYVADAFAEELFKGNPAGICLLDQWISDNTMQSIAAENNLAETAFLVKNGEDYELRWFTPECEIDLCGHATLGSAFVLMNTSEKDKGKIVFHSKSGPLTVKRNGEQYIMDFPSRNPVPVDIPENLAAALGAKILGTYRSRDLLVLLKDEETVRRLAPDFEQLKAFESYFGIVVTAQGTGSDFVSRYFAPNAGIPEDPVTGSSHCTLIPFWSERLNKTELTARQLSKRGGSLYCKDCGERVEIGGKAKLYLTGEIHL
jgi:phenazine biosynthesis protein PhzF family